MRTQLRSSPRRGEGRVERHHKTKGLERSSAASLTVMKRKALNLSAAYQKVTWVTDRDCSIHPLLLDFCCMLRSHILSLLSALLCDLKSTRCSQSVRCQMGRKSPSLFLGILLRPRRIKCQARSDAFKFQSTTFHRSSTSFSSTPFSQCIRLLSVQQSEAHCSLLRRAPPHNRT
jgi:hypothetical protein